MSALNTRTELPQAELPQAELPQAELPQLILASASPRRKAILDQLHIRCDVYRKTISEATHGIPIITAEKNACRKLKQCILSNKNISGCHVVMIAADTIVVQKGRIFNKPRTRAELITMLHALSGTRHIVITAVAVVEIGMDGKASDIIVDAEKTVVWFRQINDTLREKYCSLSAPFDKAGGYGIQDEGAVLVRKIHGCYYNVIGLPISLLDSLLQRRGYTLTDFMV